VLWVIDGAASYGAILAGLVLNAGHTVVEPARMNTKANYATGKDDPTDAKHIAESVLALPVDRLRHPRTHDGTREALAILLTARDALTSEATAYRNALTALLRRFDLGMDVRKPVTDTQITQVASWRVHPSDSPALKYARAEATRQAQRIIDLAELVATNQAELTELVQSSIAAPLLEEPGIGVVTAAQALVSYSHHGRVRDEAAFASLAGVSPLPASSGNTTRHRLNRGGDRAMNRALYVIALVRMRAHEPTRDYVAKRTAEGKTKREIMRCLKRYIARHIYRVLEAASTP
jgi:transposase